MKIEELLKTRRKQILETARKHGAYNLHVFGSVARGEGNEQSDIDFLVEVGPVHSAWFPAGLVADLEELLGRRVDIVTEDGFTGTFATAFSRRPCRCERRPGSKHWRRHCDRTVERGVPEVSAAR